MQSHEVQALLFLSAVVFVFLAVSCRRWWRRRSELDDDQFFSCESSRSLDAPLLQEAGRDDGGEWTAEEREAVASLVELFQAEGVERPTDARLLQIAWSRKLDANEAYDLYKTHLRCSERLGIGEATDEEVRQAYEGMDFVCRAGYDHEGRPLNWSRLGLCEPARMKASVCVRGTWMCQDALLDTPAANRAGLCFVQDAYGFGWKNFSADPLWMRTTLIAFPTHPSHISRVWVLDAPAIFSMCWSALKGLLPVDVRESVIFVSTNRTLGRSAGAPDEGLARICPRQSLPAYMGGDPRRFPDRVTDHLIRKLEGRDLPYRPSHRAAP